MSEETCPRGPSLQMLPHDVLETHVLPFLSQCDLSALCASSRQMQQATAPLLRRTFRCSTCRAGLFTPRDLVDPSESWRLLDLTPLHGDALPRRSFFELSEESAPKLFADERQGKANFMALRHLRQTGFSENGTNITIGILRCDGCGVYIGFQKSQLELPNNNYKPLEPSSYRLGRRTASLDGFHPPEGRILSVFEKYNSHQPQVQPRVRHRLFVCREYVELVNGRGERVNHKGQALASAHRIQVRRLLKSESHISSPSGGEEEVESGIYCGFPSCNSRLFDKDDILPWSHVLQSTRLADMDAYLEWEHAWGAARPALFVKRLLVDHSVSNVRWVRLRQGEMEVGDVFCGCCRRQVGWRFLSELSSPRLLNYDQVGRFGILRDAVRLSNKLGISRMDLLHY